jgi:hypothetical protein
VNALCSAVRFPSNSCEVCKCVNRSTDSQGDSQCLELNFSFHNKVFLQISYYCSVVTHEHCCHRIVRYKCNFVGYGQSKITKNTGLYVQPISKEQGVARWLAL